MVGLLAASFIFGQAELLSLQRQPVSVFPSRASKGVVALFILADCPIARAYSSEFKRLKTEYGAKGFDFKLVYADGDSHLEHLRMNSKEFGYDGWSFVDHGLLDRAEATISPTAAVFSPTGSLLYSGRVDNLYAALGKRRAKATTHDLRDALDAVAKGKAASNPRTRPIGCAIPRN